MPPLLHLFKMIRHPFGCTMFWPLVFDAVDAGIMPVIIRCIHESDAAFTGYENPIDATIIFWEKMG